MQIDQEKATLSPEFISKKAPQKNNKQSATGLFPQVNFFDVT